MERVEAGQLVVVVLLLLLLEVREHEVHPTGGHSGVQHLVGVRMAEQKFLVRAGAPSDDVHVDGRAGSAAGAIAHGQVRIVEGCGLGAAPLRFRTAARAGRLTAGLLGGIVRRAGLAVHDAGLALAARLARFPESLRERVVVDLELGDAIVLQKKKKTENKERTMRLVAVG